MVGPVPVGSRGQEWGAVAPWAVPVLPPSSRRRCGLLPLLVMCLVSVLVLGAGLVAFVRYGAERSAAAGGSVSRAAAGPPPRPAAVAATAHEGAAAGIAATLSIMTDGLRRRNEARFLSAVDPRVVWLMARERAVFRSLAALPLQAPEYALPGDRYDDSLTTEASGAVTAVVEFRYRFTGWDTVPAHDPLVLTFVPSGDRWLLAAGPSVREDLDLGPFAEPWMSGVRLAVEKRRHVLVVGDAARRSDLARLATRLEKAVADVRRIWPEPSWNGKVIAYASLDRRFVSEWFGDQAADGKRDRPDGQASFEARVASLPGAAPDPAKGPARLVVTPYLLRQTDTYSLSVLRHEVTHVATDRLGRYPPAWLLEGAAEYTGFRIGGARVDAARTFGQHGVSEATAGAMLDGSWRPRLVNDGHAFYEGTSQSVEDAYIDGWIAALYVADRYGDATLRRLYQAACDQPGSDGWDEVDEAALRRVLGTDHKAFTAAVRSYGVRLHRALA